MSRPYGQVSYVRDKLHAVEVYSREVLPDAAKWRAFHDDVYETYQHEGVESAMHKWAVGVGLNAVVPPPDAAFPLEVAAAMKTPAHMMGDT